MNNRIAFALLASLAVFLTGCFNENPFSSRESQDLSGQPLPLRLPPLAEFQNMQCKHKVAELFAEFREDWTPVGPWVKRQRFDLDGSSTYASPSNVIGLWYEITVYLNGEPQVRRVTNQFTKTWEFAPTEASEQDCTRSARTKRAQIFPRRANAFTDRDLGRLVKNNPNGGLIYAWSPRMPFSIEFKVAGPNGTVTDSGLSRAKAAADRLGLPLNVVMDPTVSDNQANRIRERLTQTNSPAYQTGLVNAEMFRPLQSLAMSYMGTGIHYPVMLVYKDHLLSPRMMPAWLRSTNMSSSFNNHEPP